MEISLAHPVGREAKRRGDLLKQPHRRFNPLTGKWVLVSPHRAQRPWLGQAENLLEHDQSSHDPDCYLCAGNARANGIVNPDYSGIFVFDNDFPALMSQTDDVASGDEDLFQAEPASGTCRVICFSEDHGRSLAQLQTEEIRAVIDVWASQVESLSKTHGWVQVFENKGSVMGCSNPHPHGQIWATAHIPDEVRVECDNQIAFFSDHKTSMLLQLCEKEIYKKERVVIDSEYWLAIVPWWASWPFELLLLPKFEVSSLPGLNVKQRNDLAIILSEIAVRYDNLFQCPFPYSMGWHGAPFDGQEYPGVQLHAHFYPPLLRSATVRKFMVGYEMMAEAQRDLTPEQAATALRQTSTIHYLAGNR